MKLKFLIVFAIIFGIAMWWLDAHASPALCTITGVIYDGAGNPVPNATIYFNSLNTQIVNATTIYPILVSSTTDATGTLSTTALQQGLFVQITICQVQGGGCAAPTTGFVPVASSTTFQNLLSGQAVATGSTLAGNLNASGFRITNLGANTTTGDALSQGVSSLNNLAAPTSNYAMGSHKLTGLAAGTTTGDTFAYGLNDLSQLAPSTGNYAMGGFKLQNVALAGATGDALSEGHPIGAITVSTGTFTTLSMKEVQGLQQTLTESGGGTLTPVLANGTDAYLVVTDNSAWTLLNPTGSTALVVHWWIRISNTSGGAGGTITLGINYRTDASWSTIGPADGMTRICPVLTTASNISYIGPCSGDETN